VHIGVPDPEAGARLLAVLLDGEGLQAQLRYALGVELTQTPDNQHDITNN
jgi:hypothetical protein